MGPALTAQAHALSLGQSPRVLAVLHSGSLKPRAQSFLEIPQQEATLDLQKAHLLFKGKKSTHR